MQGVAVISNADQTRGVHLGHLKELTISDVSPRFPFIQNIRR